jgi:hypothetical protein
MKAYEHAMLYNDTRGFQPRKLNVRMESQRKAYAVLGRFKYVARQTKALEPPAPTRLLIHMGYTEGETHVSDIPISN